MRRPPQSPKRLGPPKQFDDLVFSHIDGAVADYHIKSSVSETFFCLSAQFRLCRKKCMEIVKTWVAEIFFRRCDGVLKASKLFEDLLFVVKSIEQVFPHFGDSKNNSPQGLKILNPSLFAA